MADETELEEEEAGKSGKKKLIILIIIGVVVLGAAAFGMMYFLGDDGGDAAAEDAEKNTTGPIIYQPLKPEFIINYNVRRRQRFLQTQVTLMTRDKDAIDVVIEHMPLVRNNMIQVFSAQDFAGLRTTEGKDKLRKELLETIHGVVKKHIKREGIDNILFTNFVMQ